MRSSINIIKFLAVLYIALLIVLYGISLIDENRWIIINIPWASNSFDFVVAGGSFASSLVVLACELQKYQSIKRQTEIIYSPLNSLFIHKIPLFLEQPIIIL